VGKVFKNNKAMKEAAITNTNGMSQRSHSVEKSRQEKSSLLLLVVVWLVLLREVCLLLSSLHGVSLLLNQQSSISLVLLDALGLGKGPSLLVKQSLKLCQEPLLLSLGFLEASLSSGELV
jgi:hypothetical protein